MINTLIKFGESIEVKSFWDDLIDYPKLDKDKKNYLLNIIFDLDELKTDISINNLIEYDENDGDKSRDSAFIHKNIKILPGNFIPHYVCTPTKKLKQLIKSFFGKDNNGDMKMLDYFDDSKFSNLKNSDFYKVLLKIYENKDKLYFDESYIENNIKLPKKEKLVLCFTSVKWEQFNNNSDYFEISNLNGYEEFIKNIRFIESNAVTQNNKLDYAIGKNSDNVDASDFSGRDNFNKIFVTTTINYASDFNNKNFNKNYQVSKETSRLLERGANYLKDNFNVKIAGITHYVLPTFPSFSDIDIKEINSKINKQSDLLFNFNELRSFSENIEDISTSNLFWLNYVAYQTDGKSFKIINLINDVNNFYVFDILKTLFNVSETIKRLFGINRLFNFYSIYNIIPVREKNARKNIALDILDDIFERNKIKSEKIFLYFKDLILCHRFSRYKSYTNIRNFDNFDNAIKVSVINYFALIQILKQLKLYKYKNMNGDNFKVFNMEDEQMQDASKDLKLYEKINLQINNFFDIMDYSDKQKSLFFLGRALSRIAYAQEQKGHSKPVLNKLNYNGMDKKDILRLRNDLSEKARQYNIVDEANYYFKEFTRLFDYNNWDMDANEALFFILSGYSFGFVQSK